jgi:hypothetical protein
MANTKASRGWVQMTFNCATYHTETADQNNLYTSVLLDGSGTCQPTPDCPCGSATHTPQATNKIGSVGGTITRSRQCVSCYASLQNNQSVAAQNNALFSYSAGGDIVCSLVGESFYQLFNLPLEKAFEMIVGPNPGKNCQTNSNGVTLCHFSTSPWCTAATSPPDMNVIDYVADQKTLLPFFAENIAGCARTINPKGPWICGYAVGVIVHQGSYGEPLSSCTHNP